MLSTSQIEQILNEYEHVSEYAGSTHRDSGWDEWDGKSEPVAVPNLGWVHVVENVGGEGQGDHQHMVFKVLDFAGGARFFKKTGYYSSFDGGEWDGDFEEVKPVEKTVTVYE